MEPKLTQNWLKLTRIYPQSILKSLERFGDQKFSTFIWTMKPKISTKLLIWLKISWSPNWLKIGSNWPEYIPHWSNKVWKDLETISFQPSFEQRTKISTKLLIWLKISWSPNWLKIDSNWPEYIPHWSYKVWKDLETKSFQASFAQCWQ